MLEESLFFTASSCIQSFNSSLFPNTVSQDIFGTLPLSVQYLCDLRDTMLCHWLPSTSHRNLPREGFPNEGFPRDFPRSGKYPKVVLLLTFLAYLQPVK